MSRPLSHRYALFAGEDYADGAGWDHFQTFGDSVEALRSIAVAASGWSWFQVVDLIDGEVVERGDLQEIRRALCTHPDTYRVEIPAGGEIIASGHLQAPGEYCADCRKRLGD